MFEQDPILLEAVSVFSARIKALPSDPRFPHREPRALAVGGFVRDALIGKHPKDLDIEVYGLSADRLKSLLEQTFPRRVRLVGEQFQVLKVALRTEEEGGHLELDVSIPRRDSKTGRGHKDFTITGDPDMSVVEAARRRDFTWNAFAADMLTGQLFDYFGGLADLETRALRVTDPEQFVDDPLRVYRALQFKARLECTVEEETYALLKQMVERGDLDHLPRERVTEELLKLMLKSERPSIGLELGRELGIFERYFPELHALVGTPQEPDWHPEGDVWVHTMMAIDAAAAIIRQESRAFTEDEKTQVMFGTLAHDLGKPVTTEVVDGRVRSLDHERAGAEPARAFFQRLVLESRQTDAMVRAVEEHLKPNMLFRALEKGAKGERGGMGERQYANAIRKLLKRMRPLSWRVLIAISEADSRGHAFPDASTRAYETGDAFRRTILAQRLDEEAAKDLISGEDVLEMGRTLGIPVREGVLIGDVIREVEERRDLGEIRTREEALALLPRLVEDRRLHFEAGPPPRKGRRR